LRKIFRLEYEHSIGNDWVVRHQGRYYQLERQRRNYAPAGSKVTVWEAKDGTLGIEYRGQALRWKEIAAPVKAEKTTTRPGERTAAAPRRKTIPRADHPWRQRMNLTTDERQSVLDLRGNIPTFIRKRPFYPPFRPSIRTPILPTTPTS